MSTDHAEATLRASRQEQARKTLCDGKIPKASAKTRWDLLDSAIHYIGARKQVAVLEFGVAKGASMQHFVDGFTNKKTFFFGFDSFEGLPEDWTPGPKFAKGTFSTSGQIPDIDDPRVRFIKGWFQDSVPQFMRGSFFNWPILVHFDAKLYSSTLFLLVNLWHWTQEYFFIMNDFAFDESVALHDFSTAFPTEIEWLANRRNHHGVPVQVFGRMKRAEFQMGEHPTNPPP